MTIRKIFLYMYKTNIKKHNYMTISQMNYIAIKHKYLSNQSNDINEHLNTMVNYTKDSESVLALCWQGSQVFWTLAHGLLSNKTSEQKKNIYYNNIINFDTEEFTNVTRHLKNLSVTFSKEEFYQYELPSEQPTVDVLFIDSWHVYGCMKRELAKYAPKTNKYIMMHDTTVDEWDGETIRSGLNADEQSQKYGIPIYEINRGVWPAIQEFLNDNPQWKIKERFTNNHGFTVLERVSPDP